MVDSVSKWIKVQGLVPFRMQWLWIAVGISFVLSLTPWGKFVLYPFKLFTTWVHECGHATMAMLWGGSVKSITLSPDTSGLTQFTLPQSRIARAAVATSGYLGASLFGCILIYAHRYKNASHLIITVLGVLLMLTVVLWIRNGFGVLVAIGLGGAMLYIGRSGHGPIADFLLTFLAVQTALNSLFDIRVLFSLDSSQGSDASTMQSLFFLPAWFWAFSWMGTSIAMLYWTFKMMAK